MTCTNKDILGTRYKCIYNILSVNLLTMVFNKTDFYIESYDYQDIFFFTGGAVMVMIVW